jgi:hypothetical protein
MALGAHTCNRTLTHPYPRVWVGYGCILSSMGGCGWVHIYIIQWPQGPLAASQPSGRSLVKIVEQRAIKNKVQYIHCR